MKYRNPKPKKLTIEDYAEEIENVTIELMEALEKLDGTEKLLKQRDEQVLDWQNKYYDEWRLNKKIVKREQKGIKEYARNTGKFQNRISELEGSIRESKLFFRLSRWLKKLLRKRSL